jgi:hypothetical protein
MKLYKSQADEILSALVVIFIISFFNLPAGRSAAAKGWTLNNTSTAASSFRVQF